MKYLFPNEKDRHKDIVAFVYITPLVLVRHPRSLKSVVGRDPHYVVGARYAVHYQLRGDQGWRMVVVPEGLLTDLASVPAIARGYVGRVGRHLEAAVVHDYLYGAWQNIKGGEPLECHRAFADRLFLAGMRAAGVSRFKSWSIYKAVSLFGRKAYCQTCVTRDPDWGRGPRYVLQTTNTQKEVS